MVKLKLGEVAVETIHAWAPQPGSVVSWRPSPATLAKASQAPISAVPPSYLQAHHLHNYLTYAARGMEMSRLLIIAWDIPGRCDIRAMTHVINSHLRRHDTYHSWFEHTDGEHFARRIIDGPRDIEFIPTKHGAMTAPAELQSHILAIPNPFQWDCFRFTIIQRADHFTFCAGIDHIHGDGMFGALAFAEIHMSYSALVSCQPPIRLPNPGSYHDYCVRQHQYASALNLNSPEIRAWAQFFENNYENLAHPLPLGDTSVSEILGVQLLDGPQTAQFESACISAGARFVSGVFACAALLEHELTGAETYSTIIPVHTRHTPADFVTMGWFTGFVPVTVPATGSSFGDIVAAAQESYDSGGYLSDVPLERVQELVPWLRERKWEAPWLFFWDAGMPPISALASPQIAGLNARVCEDGGNMEQLHLRVNRLENETQLMVMFPNNPIARESVTRYIEGLKSVFVRVAEGRYPVAPPLRNGAQLHPSSLPSR